ncbi:hypothetical protein GCM10009017_11260 [Halarchaeum rubridurum]|uniref:Uncharacterized protein n=1 Tax=Halarchaeum rubridurum TaxID=489911 RepID=A0A830FUE7_9EURY|nr:hypothetical protein GCM10009017_11260 [Halarchaeum rubridurum]
MAAVKGEGTVAGGSLSRVVASDRSMAGTDSMAESKNTTAQSAMRGDAGQPTRLRDGVTRLGVQRRDDECS